MAGRQIVVEIVGDSTGFSKATDEAVTKSQSLTDKFKDFGKGAAIGAGIASFNLLSDAIDIGISKLGDAHQAFLDDQVSSEKLAQSLKNNVPAWDGNTSAVEAYASAQENLGFSDDEVRDSLGQLVGVTHDATEAMNLNGIAQDLARAKGIDLATASDIVTKAYEGNGKALKGLGIDIAGAKTGAELLDAVQKNVAGSASAWADTNQGKLAVSNQKVQEAMEKVGGVLDNLAQAVLPVFADGLTLMVDILGNVWDAIHPVVNILAGALKDAITAIRPIAIAVFGAVNDAVRALQPVFRVVGSVIGGIMNALGQSFRGWATVVGAVAGIVGGIIGNIVKVIQVDFATIGSVIRVLQAAFRAAGTVVSNVFQSIGSVIRGSINFVIGAVNSIIRAINGIQLHININPPIGPSINFDWNGVNLHTLPYLHTGGIVPGAPGSDVLAVLQAGERVTPAGGVGQNIVIQIDSFIGSDRDIDRFADKVALRLRVS